MSIRDQRLKRELIYMQELRASSHRIDFIAQGNPPDTYVVTFRCLGMIAADRTGREHVAQIYLHAGYPRQAPQVSILTPCFHPNIAALFQMAPFQHHVQEMLDQAPDEQARQQLMEHLTKDDKLFKGHVCLDILDRNWSLSITLDKICLDLGELIQYKRHNVDDPLNHEAAEWTRRNLDRLPIDRTELLDQKALDDIRLVAERPGPEPEILLRIGEEEAIDVRVRQRDR